MHLRLVFRAPNFKSSKNFVKVVQHSALSYSLTWINPARAKIDRNFILADLTWNRRAELTNCGYLEKNCYLYTRTPNELCTEISFWLIINSSTVTKKICILLINIKSQSTATYLIVLLWK